MNITIYTSPTCGPCKKIKPLLFRAAVERNWIVEEVDISKEYYPDWVTVVPTARVEFVEDTFTFEGAESIKEGLSL